MAGGLIEEGDGRDGRRLSRGKQLLEIVHGKAGVDDILDDDHVAARDVVIQVLDQTHNARGLRARAVARDGNEVHVDGAVHAAAEIDVEKRSAF